MVDDFKGVLEGISPGEAYDQYDLIRGYFYCNDWMDAGKTRDEIGDFDLMEFRDWCVGKLGERRK